MCAADPAGNRWGGEEGIDDEVVRDAGMRVLSARRCEGLTDAGHDEIVGRRIRYDERELQRMRGPVAVSDGSRASSTRCLITWP